MTRCVRIGRSNIRFDFCTVVICRVQTIHHSWDWLPAKFCFVSYSWIVIIVLTFPLEKQLQMVKFSSFLTHNNHCVIELSNHPWFFIYIPVSYLSVNHSDKTSQFIYPYTNILLFPYYIFHFQTGFWYLIWYLASSILSLASSIWHLI